MPNILMKQFFIWSFVVQLRWIHQYFYPWTVNQTYLFSTCYVNSIVSSLWLVLKECEECSLFSRILQCTLTNKTTNRNSIILNFKNPPIFPHYNENDVSSMASFISHPNYSALICTHWRLFSVYIYNFLLLGFFSGPWVWKDCTWQAGSAEELMP